MDRQFEISWASLWRIFTFLVIAVIMFLGRKILLALFLAIVISSGLEFLVHFLEKKGLPRTLGVILIFLTATLLITFTIYTIVPLLLIDLNNAFAKLTKAGIDTGWGPILSAKTAKTLGAVIDKISSEILSGNGAPFAAVSDVVGGVVLAISILISAFYLSLSHDGIERFVRAVFPANYEISALRIYERARRRIGLWFRTQILLSFIMGAMTLLALLALGVKYAFLLAILAGFFELVPYVGPILSGAAAVLAAISTSPTLALWTLVVFFLIHQIENHVLVPVLVGRNVGLHPVIVIVALLIGVEVGGFMGILVSVPAAVVFQEVIEDWSGRKRSQELAFE